MKKIIISLIIFFLAFTSIAQVQLYGLTAYGGANEQGTVFHYTPSTATHTADQTLFLLSGAVPVSDMTDGGNGKFYGMTSYGGTINNGVGVIFEWDPATNIYTDKIDFVQGNNGWQPYGSLTLFNNKFYGMTRYGGTPGPGVIFEWDPATNIYTKKIDLTSSGGTFPYNIHLALLAGKFYGTTQNGGANNKGVIFEWDPATNIYTKKIDLGGANGENPGGSLTLSNGKFYGMTNQGGANNKGVIFEWDPATNIYTKKIDLGGANGEIPYGGSLTWSAGKFYGMTNQGGANNSGVIFEWDPATNIYIHKFDFGGSNGSVPRGSLTWNAGKFYGMTYQGGANNRGVIFEWDPATNTYSKKTDLSSTNGAYPYSSLLLSSGKFYGMTSSGGAAGYGVIFEWDPATNIYIKKIDFNLATQGSHPNGSLTWSAGKFYGMTNQGGANNYGVIFEWDPATSTYTKKIDFDIINGTWPSGSLTLNNGKFYGMTGGGGANNYGVIFEWDPATNIYTKKIDLGGANGENPYGSLTLNNGKFYGMTIGGGANSLGVLFEWDPATNIYTKKIDLGGTNGGYPSGSLTWSAGKFYGMTFQGGANNRGVIFEWDHVTNIFTKKVDFNGANGEAPYGSLTVSNGKLYGMTSSGGASGWGVIFEWDPGTNTYTKKIDLTAINGGNSQGSLTLSNGKLYGMARNGGANGIGVIFEWNPVTNTYTKLVDFNGANGSAPSGDLVVSNNNPLPIHLLSFSATLQNTNNARLQWQIATAEDGGKYELQRSTNVPGFTAINLQTGNSFVTQFNYTDNLLPNGTYYYRLKMTDKDGKLTYSNVAIVKVGSKEQLIVVYPNPVKRGESLQLTLQNITATKIEIINIVGQVVYSSTAKQTGSFSLPISSSLMPGQYVVRVVSESKIDVKKILIQ
jgi:uncharacterized repeat protein (TIGR03803 family)